MMLPALFSTWCFLLAFLLDNQRDQHQRSHKWKSKKLPYLNHFTLDVRKTALNIVTTLDINYYLWIFLWQWMHGLVLWLDAVKLCSSAKTFSCLEYALIWSKIWSIQNICQWYPCSGSDCWWDNQGSKDNYYCCCCINCTVTVNLTSAIVVVAAAVVAVPSCKLK